MQMNVRERLQDNRPYWKVIVSLVFSLIGTILFIYIGIWALSFFMPFVIGWFLAFLASPLVLWLEKRLKIVKKLSSAIVVILVLVGCVALIYFAGSKLWNEVSSLIRNFPELYQDLEKGLTEISGKGSQFFKLLPEGVQNGFQTMAANLDKTAGDLIAGISEPTVEAAGNFAKGIPSILVSTIVTIISAYFFISDREAVLIWAKKISPEPIVKRMTMVMDNLKYAVGGYLKAQFKIMGVVFLILLLGFSVMRIHFSILLALGIAFLDFLPFFGTGTALLPWALYKLLVGDYRTMAGLIIIYAVTQIVRQIIQPKIVGESMGLPPLMTLFLLYLGFKLRGLTGMILAVPVGLVFINFYKYGAFDSMIRNFRMLMEAIQKFRREE